MDLDRFVVAQDQGATYDRALAELRAGRKRSHWMWFVFPQLAGLGRSPTAEAYAIADLAEARAYLAHDVLGPRLRECCRALLRLEDVSADQVLGGVDAIKLRSSMTLFAVAAQGQDERSERLFADVLDRFYAGEGDPLTTRLLG